ncbi:carbohydrate-binding family 9-like protein [Flavivirga amylovorans]|uniref:Carbohydrate-binding family 9-like protein n=1 Tax=Flavivirga amylovorans TaxID=870486 RepID=A0ABT8WX07_9FLAO|nr:carbohydrate-binding family 9-like protein [Flavivirga amylovorans]MDO5986219.1 carbohydrate-binding family 9-like protein [Flavivirga amylovorans]
MNTWYLIIVGLLLVNCAGAQKADKKMVLGEQPVFKVSRANEAIVVDGKMDESIWDKTEARTFDYTYNNTKPTDKQKSTFRMLWDEKNLYLFYEFEDKFLNARETKRDGKPFFDDCAEIFIIPVPDSLDTHFGFEVNMYQASNDIIFFNNYYKGKDYGLKTFNPEFKTAVTYNGTINDDSDIDKGWTMEMEIPIAVFGFLGGIVPVEKGNTWAFLAIRQDRNEKKGDRRITSTLFPIYDIEKDVHQPNRFGLMEFVD